ncbi:MAG: hypothetical protein LUC94_14840 [Clostridiales bacterium]|nr:hypothetical protein [Clostridiales bacterium]
MEYVELLLNTVESCIAIRPCDKDNPNAIRWGALKEDGRWAVLSKSCRGFAQPLYSLMGWNPVCGYRMRGQYLERDGEKLMLFDLNEPEVTVREEPEEEQETETAEATAEENALEAEPKKRKQPARIITLYPLSWADSFGGEAGKIHLLERVKYSGNWDALRPAKAVENVQDFTREKVDALMDKAQDIIDRMRKAV